MTSPTEPASPPPLHLAWARFLRDRFPGTAGIARHHDTPGRKTVHVFESRRADGMVGATIGVMDRDQGVAGRPIHAEVLMARRGHDARMGAILATIALHILGEGWRIRPGTVFEQMLAMHDGPAALPHVYFTAPYAWPDLGAVALDGRTLYPLLAIPVSPAEADLAGEERGRALEDLWAARETDVLDWDRVGVA